MTAGPEISVVVPLFRAEKTLLQLCERLTSSLSALTPDFEIVLVDDRSPDRTWAMLLELLPRFPHIVAIRLSRNFGQHYAITAGLDVARGRWVVLMDCDLQDQPEDIGLLWAKAREGYDIVLARRMARKDGLAKRLSSAVFYKSFALLSGYTLDRSVGSFRIMERRVVDAFCRMREAFRLVGGMIDWLGFSTACVETRHEAREGQSTYTWRLLFRVALDGMISFSNRPLYLSVLFGAAMALVATMCAAAVILYFVAGGLSGVPGWLSLMTVTTLIGGLILFNLGVIGIYLGRLYDQTKQRPLYVVDHVVVGALVAADGRRDAHVPGC